MVTNRYWASVSGCNMKNASIINQLLIIACAMIFPCELFAIDIVKTKYQKVYSKKSLHKIEVIMRALEITEAEYGPFKHEVIPDTISAGRALKASVQRGVINTVLLPADNFWDEAAIPIKVPVRLGLLSYRLLLINKADLSVFANLHSLSGLKRLTAGLITEWATTEVFRSNNMNLVGTSHFDGIFLMLKKHRFDYIPRGAHEVYDEVEKAKLVSHNIVVEPTITLYLPTSCYIYVSKSEPRLAKRLTSGLNRLLQTGELKDILYQYFSDEIEQANISERRMIKMENPYHNKNSKNDAQYYLFNQLPKNVK